MRLSSMIRIGLAMPALLALASCASGPAAPPRSGPAATVVETLARPVPFEMFARQDPYLIGPYDVISYAVQDIEGVSGEIQVDAGGEIQVPLAGTVTAAGRTSTELAREITRLLRANYVRDPQVSINLVRMQSRFVTVEGSVVQPGLYPLVPDMTLTKAVASARGLSDRASTKRVFVQRKIGGQTFLAIHDLSAIRSGVYPDPEIYPNDVVIVDNAPGRQLLRDLLQILPSLISPLYLVLDSN